MRVVVRCQEARAAREAQELLAAAGVTAMAMPGSVRAAPDGEDITIIAALDGDLEAAALISRDVRALETAPIAVLVAVRGDAPPALGIGGDASFNDWIALDAPSNLLGAQVEAAIRAASAEDERSCRSATAGALNTNALTPVEPRNLKALYIGAPSPTFLSLETAFSQHGGVTAAAFSSFTGFDHLHDEDFDAVVLNGVNDPGTAISLCAALRRNASLHHLPTMVVTRPDDSNTAAASIERGACAIVAATAPSGPSLGWLFEAIRRERRRRAAEHDLRALRDQMGDARTGLFLHAPFDIHLARLAADHHASGRPLALAVLRVLPAHGARQPSDAVWKKGFNEIASLAGRLMRETDSGAAIADDLIAIALPATDFAGAKRSAERIASVCECTAFAAGDGGAGPLIFEQSCAELQAGESGAGMLARALRAIEVESIPA